MNPYLSIVFVNRNDGYGLDQSTRIKDFISFYSYYDKVYPDLFEILVCDWNPIANKPLLKDEYCWNSFSKVKHFVVREDIHKKLDPKGHRPMLDYIGRNVCARRASGTFVMIINQDIFLSKSIFELLSKRKLSDKFFYRTDRCDFEFDEPFSDWKNFDDFAKPKVFLRHIRPKSRRREMSLSIDADNTHYNITKPKFIEYVSEDRIAYSSFYGFIKFITNIGNVLFKPRFLLNKARYYKRYFLHTNASGDFLLAPKKAFFDTNGFVETNEFYMHTDSYMCVQLFMAGYNQAILLEPHCAFHRDHSRAEREGRHESMSYKDHAEKFADICTLKASYKLNNDSWGLRDFAIEEHSEV